MTSPESGTAKGRARMRQVDVRSGVLFLQSRDGFEKENRRRTRGEQRQHFETIFTIFCERHAIH